MQRVSVSTRARAAAVGAVVALVECTGSSPPIEAEPEPCVPDCVVQPCTAGYPEPLPPKVPDVGDEIGFRNGCDVLERDSDERPVLYRCDDDETLSVEYDAEGRVTSALDIADLPGGLSETSWQFAYDDTGRAHEVVSEGRHNGALQYQGILAATFDGDTPVLEDRHVRVRPPGDTRFIVDGFEVYHLVRSWRPDGLFVSSELRGHDDTYLAERVEHAYDDSDRLIRVDAFRDDPAMVGVPPGCESLSETSYACSTMFVYDEAGALVRLETGDHIETVSDRCCIDGCEP